MIRSPWRSCWRSVHGDDDGDADRALAVLRGQFAVAGEGGEYRRGQWIALPDAARVERGPEAGVTLVRIALHEAGASVDGGRRDGAGQAFGLCAGLRRAAGIGGEAQACGAGVGAGLERVPLLAVAFLEPGGSAASPPPPPEQPANNSPVVKVPQQHSRTRLRYSITVPHPHTRSPQGAHRQCRDGTTTVTGHWKYVVLFGQPPASAGSGPEYSQHSTYEDFAIARGSHEPLPTCMKSPLSLRTVGR